AGEKQPLVLQLCGHNANGKAAGNGQRLLFTLARAGFTTASIDPIGQGERYQYELDTDNPVRQHNLAGKLLQLEGEFFGSWRLHDARCALDYLLSRNDVDTSRVGVCGTSGGGTLSSYLFALDERIHAAAPACFITTYMHNFNNELPTDVEQIPPGLWENGGDMADFVIARAPAPAIILDVENDFFDVRGTAESFEEAKKIYSLLGKEENCEMYIGPGSHCLSPELRKATFDFFVKHFLDTVPEYEMIEPWPDDVLYAAPDGKITTLPNELTIGQWFTCKAEELAAKRNPDAEQISAFLKKAFDVKHDDNAVPEYRHSQGWETPEFAIETDEFCEAILHIAERNLHHLKKAETITLVVGHLDAMEDMSKVEEYDGTLCGLDVRGIGRSRSLGCDRKENFFDFYDSDYFFDANGQLLNSYYLAGKVRDLRKTVALLRSNGCRRLIIKAHGLGALVTLFTLGVDPALADTVRLTGLPESYGSFTGNSDVLWPQSHMIPGMLKVFDIPDLCAILEKSIDFQASEFLDRMMEPVK
ncbi:MAG: acetylxylan esterase, partial [Lentisphaeria bacterium]|nr:acetylxylan esterase [Lentisphaeria bacterium]